MGGRGLRERGRLPTTPPAHPIDWNTFFYIKHWNSAWVADAASLRGGWVGG